MELGELIRTRRSVRNWEDRDVPDGLIERALELATWAPNGGNRQMWRFVVVKNRQLIARMAGAVQAKSDLMASWPEAGEYREDTARWQRSSVFFRHAPVCIAVCAAGYESTADIIMGRRGEADPEAARMMDARRFASSRVQSAAAATAYLLLAFHQMGLGACWMGAPLQAKREIEELLDVPAGTELVAVVPVGYPAEEGKSTGRRPVSEVARFIR